MRTLLLAALTVALCPAATLVTTFGPGDSFDNTNKYPFVGPGDTTVDYAVSFILSSAATFTRVRLALDSAAQIQLEIRQGADPNGALIESVFDTFSPGILTIESVLNPTLFAGTQYWLVARSPGLLFPDTGWFYNDQGFTGLSIETAPSIFTPSTGTSPAYEIQGDLSAVPEPATWSLLALAGICAVVRRRRSA